MARRKSDSPNWGGARPNSGPHVRVEGRKRIGLQLTEAQVDWLDERVANDNGESRSDIVRNMIARAMKRTAAK